MFIRNSTAEKYYSKQLQVTTTATYTRGYFQRFMKLKLPVCVTLYFEGRLAFQFSYNLATVAFFMHKRWRHIVYLIIFLFDSILLVLSFSLRCFISSHKFVTSQHGFQLNYHRDDFFGVSRLQSWFSCSEHYKPIEMIDI